MVVVGDIFVVCNKKISITEEEDRIGGWKSGSKQHWIAYGFFFIL